MAITERHKYFNTPLLSGEYDRAFIPRICGIRGISQGNLRHLFSLFQLPEFRPELDKDNRGVRSFCYFWFVRGDNPERDGILEGRSEHSRNPGWIARSKHHRSSDKEARSEQAECQHRRKSRVS